MALSIRLMTRLDLIVELTKKGYRPFQDIHYLELKDGEHNLKTWAEAMPTFFEMGFWEQIKSIVKLSNAQLLIENLWLKL
jgi:hypothetical protein